MSAKFSSYCFYMNTNKHIGRFPNCISAPLTYVRKGSDDGNYPGTYERKIKNIALETKILFTCATKF